MNGLCPNTSKSNKFPVGRAVNKQWISRMSRSYCLSGKTTCPFEHSEQKGGVLGADLLLFVHPHKEKRWPFSSEAEFLTLHRAQLNYLHLDSKSKRQHSNNLWGICRREIGRSNFANSFLCPLFKFPFGQNAHLGRGASNHFKESSPFWWIFWGHGPRRVMG